MIPVARNKPGLAADLLFFACLLAGLFPVLRYAHFTTLDGAAHCYNAGIMQSLAIDGPGFYKDWYVANGFPVPNYSGHVLLALLHLLVSWNTAEKIIALLFLVSAPLLFRKIVLHTNPANRWWPLVIFPFTHYIFLYYGFYNFSLGIIFLLAGIYLRLKTPVLSKKQLLQVFALSVLLYFSHLFTFLIYLFFIAACEASDVFNTKDLKRFATRSLKLLLVTAPFALLAIFYFRFNPSQEDVFWPASKTIRFCLSADYLKVFKLENNYFCNVLAWALLMLGLGGTVFYAVCRIRKKETASAPVFLLMFILMAVLAFSMPDYSGNAGYIVYRFVYLGMLFLLLWTGSLSINRCITLAAIILVIVCHIGIQVRNAKEQYYINADYEAYIKAADHIKDHSVVAPVFLSGRGFEEHFSNYLCGNKQMVILENYEAGTNYFPVKWNKGSMPQAYFTGSLGYLNTMGLPHGSSPRTVMPDYIVLQGRTSLLDTMIQNISRSFSLIYSNNTVILYKKKDL